MKLHYNSQSMIIVIFCVFPNLKPFSTFLSTFMPTLAKIFKISQKYPVYD